jgi:hypothetical protein
MGWSKLRQYEPRSFRLFPFSVSEIRFYSEGISDERLRVRIASQAEVMRFNMKTGVSKNFVIRISVYLRKYISICILK